MNASLEVGIYIFGVIKWKSLWDGGGGKQNYWLSFYLEVAHSVKIFAFFTMLIIFPEQWKKP